MSEELKVTIYEPSKDPRTVSKNIDSEFVPLIDRGVFFNADGSLCDDFQQLPEDLSADEMIGFNLDLPPPALNKDPLPPALNKDSLPPALIKDSLPPALIKDSWPPALNKDSLPPPSDTVKYTDAVYPILQRQQKLQKQIDKLKKVKNVPLKNKLNKLRKKLKWAKESEMALLADPESCVYPPAGATSQPQNNLQQAFPSSNRKPPNFKKKKKKKAHPKSPANNAGSLQTPNPSRFPAFIRNPWMKKNSPKNAPRMNTPANNSLDFIPIGNRNGHPRFRYNSRVPPLANTNRYFSLENC